MEKSKIKYDIAIDLDNTLCTSIRRNHSEDILRVKPKKKMLKILLDLKERGHKIIIFTRRNACGKNARNLTKKWLKKYKIPYDKLITNKPHFDILIDDRGFNPYQGGIINFRRIEIECDEIWKLMRNNIYRPRRRKK